MYQKNRNSILFVSSFSDINSAYSNRLLAKINGIKENHIRFFLLNIKQSNIVNSLDKSSVYNLKINNKIIYFLIVLIRSVREIYNTKYIYVDITDNLTLSWFLLFSFIFNKKIFHERTEYPDLRKKKHLYDKVRFAYYHFLCRRMNGMIVISDALKDYFIKKRVKENRIFKFPMLIDPTRFENCNRMDKVEKYIAYCGDMKGNKDGLEDLIQAFNIFSKIKTDINLYLIGDSLNPNDFKLIKHKVKELNLENKIIFTGRIDRNEMPYYLCNAEVLVLARPNNYQAQGGFPTKLGEYLATGKPVIITRTGEIDSYLEDNKDCFFVEPDNPQAFADRLCDVFADYDFALKVGQEGKKKVYNEFNYKVQTAKLIEFIEQVV